MAEIDVRQDTSGRIVVSFPYNPFLIAKVKTIYGHKWHPDKKHWSLPNNNGILQKILEVFKGEKILIDPTLQSNLSGTVIARDKVPKQSHHEFQDLRRELLSRKYSYKTVKSYIYYNRNLLQFTNKQSSEIDDNDIKNYLLYLAEEKQSATSTLNQAINALKFYYGTMLKKKFVYEVRRPRKDKNYLSF